MTAISHSDGVLDGAQDALNKMRRAYERGTGCRLTAEEIRSLSLSLVGELWDQDDPRAPSAPTPKGEPLQGPKS